MKTDEEYYLKIRNKLIDNEVYKRVKDYSINRHELQTYFEVGRILNNVGKNYGDNIIKEYSIKLVIEVNKLYNERTLRRMRQFYRTFSNKKWSTLSTKLSWSHYSELLPYDDVNKIKYYIEITEKYSLSVRKLREKIKQNEYERLPESTKLKLINKEEISEKVLQQLILEDIFNFLKQLGEGFTFVGNEYPIKIGNTYNYIDILLFNVNYNCYVVIELKVAKLKKEHIGQIELYMNYIDKNLKTLNHSNTMGIIIYKEGNKGFIDNISYERRNL